MTAQCHPRESAQISAERGARAIENDLGYNHFKCASRAPLTDGNLPIFNGVHP